VSGPQAYDLISDTVPNDANHLHVTFIDKDEKRAVAAMEDFKTKQPDVAKTVHIHAYQADDPTVKDAGFVTTGTPTVYIQQGRKTVGREDTYPGAETLAQAVRRKQPDYDPSKDPSISGGGSADLNALLEKLKTLISKNPIISTIIGIIVALFVKNKLDDKKKPVQPQTPVN
jgi:hypothetical protein